MLWHKKLTTFLMFVFVIDVLLKRTKAFNQITGPPRSVTHFVGENAHFRWSSNDNSILFSATWGIRKGNIADPQFIHVNILSNKTNVNSDLKPDLISRLSFDGDLRKGQAWFVLKNVTVNDTNEYLARISEDGTGVLLYTVELTVKRRKARENKSEKPTKQPKQPKYQSVSSKLPPRVETSMKEAETETNKPHTSEDPKKPEFSNVALPVIIVVFALAFLILVIVLVVVAILKRRQVLKNSNKTSSSKKLLQV